MADIGQTEMGAPNPRIEAIVEQGQVEAIAATNIRSRKARWLRSLGAGILGVTAVASAVAFGPWMIPLLKAGLLAKVGLGLATGGIVGAGALVGGVAQGGAAAISRGLR